METKLIILRGNGDSAKTLLAHRLQAALGPSSLVISQAVVRDRILHVHDQPGNLAIGVIKQLAACNNRQIEYVIVEGILVSARYRAMLVSLMRQFERALVYHFDGPVPETVVSHRHLKLRWLLHDRLNVPQEYQFPTNLSLEAQTAQVLADLRA
ncbi:P-loop NTPase family protein [Lactiplantibacillus songbeiensis]|jgi:hypothetical protein|uniref:Kinase n=1 Tax=Lactiplantibacillus songbeiensis TaxID=2559920 RepID=A0ABW4BY17_9LACO|nr:kinase [Lactiplantibacillus songbeiensis]